MMPTMLSDEERTDYELLGRAKVIIEWLVNRPGAESAAYAREWLKRYKQQMLIKQQDSEKAEP